MVGTMKNRIKISTILFTCTVALMPLCATGSYTITETERSVSINPLDILNGREKHHSRKVSGRKLIKQNGKQHLRTNIYRRKTLYLTFDDGPGKGTANVLRILKEENVEGTMFFIGRKVERHRALYGQALSMPNLLIANHTYSHANGKYEKFYSHAATVIKDVDRAQRIIGGAKYLRLAGRNVWRLPQTQRNDYSLSKARRVIESPKYTALAGRGYHIYGWDIEWQFDHSTGKPSYSADHMISRINALYRSQHLVIQGKMVLLAHDAMFRTQSGLQQLRELIQILKADAWQFETIDHFTRSTPAVFVRNKASAASPKVIHLAMSKKSPLAQRSRQRKDILKILRQD